MYPCNIHFAFPSYFGFTKSYQNSCITVLPISSIDKPILTSLFMNFCVFSISIANKFPENFFLLYESLVQKSNKSSFLRLLQA